MKQIDLPLYKFYLIEGMTQEDLNELALERNNLSEEVYRLNQYVDFYKDLGEKQNKELQNLKQANEEHQKINGELRVENERLNNIINKAKMYCEDVIQEHENGEYDVDTVWLAIKEHKGNIKSVLNILNGDLENYWIR